MYFFQYTALIIFLQNTLCASMHIIQLDFQEHCQHSQPSVKNRPNCFHIDS